MIDRHREEGKENKEGRNDKAAEVIAHLAAEFLSRESNRMSLITVTDVDLARDMSQAIILVSVFPDDKAKGALDFMKRQRYDFREYVRQNSRLKRIPKFDFEIDAGEKHRQHIDELLRE